MAHRRITPDLHRAWAEEVRFLHSLWRHGPPQSPNGSRRPNPNPSLRPTNATEFKKKRKKKKKGKNVADQPPPSGVEWPVDPAPDPAPEPSGWPEPAPNAHRRAPLPEADQARAATLYLQQSVLKSCREFLSKDGSDADNEEMSEEEDEEEEKAFEFFVGVFGSDDDLRGYYEKSHEKGEFLCLVCGGTGVKLGKRYGNCVALVQHSCAISKTKRRAAHRGFGRAVCRVLGWDIKRLPSIVLDLKEPLGQSLVKTAEAQNNAQNDHSGGDLMDSSNINETEEPLLKEDGNITVDMPYDNAQKNHSSGDLMNTNNINEPEEPNKGGIIINEKEELMANDKHMVSSPYNHPVAEIAGQVQPSLGSEPNDGGHNLALRAANTETMKTSTEEHARDTAAEVQKNGLKECQNFLPMLDASSSGDIENDDKKRESVSYKFFLELFEKDHDLKNYYVRNSHAKEFCCLVCGGIGRKTSKRYINSTALVTHSMSITTKPKRPWAHRAFGRAVREILAWNSGNTNVDASGKSQWQNLENSS